MELTKEWMEKATKDFAEFLDTTATGNARGECFENCARFIIEKPEFDGGPVILCQGKVWNQTNSYHPHAWLEWGDGMGLVIDPSNDAPTAAIFPKPSYLAAGQCKSVRRFSINEVRRLLLKTRHYGPWRA